MGRPIKKIFIGERGAGSPGGNGVASVTLGGTNNSSGYTDLDAVTIGAPDIVDGVQAVGHVLETAGVIDSVVITEPGSGYTSPPTVTADTGTQGTLTLTAVLETGGALVIQSTAYVTSSNLSADMIAQKGDITYRVETSEGILECDLINDDPTAVGEMAIIATDSASGTYYVTKLYNNTVRLDPTNGTGSQFALGDKVEWAKDGVAVVNYSVSISA